MNLFFLFTVLLHIHIVIELDMIHEESLIGVVIAWTAVKVRWVLNFFIFAMRVWWHDKSLVHWVFNFWFVVFRSLFKAFNVFVKRSKFWIKLAISKVRSRFGTHLFAVGILILILVPEFSKYVIQFLDFFLNDFSFWSSLLLRTHLRINLKLVFSSLTVVDTFIQFVVFLILQIFLILELCASI